MRKSVPVAACFYAESGQTLAQLLEAAFRLYLISAVGAAGSRKPCPR